MSSTPRKAARSRPKAAPTRPRVRKPARAKPAPPPGTAAARLIDERIRSLGGWRAETLAEVRRLIREADPEVVEACKWVKPTNPLGVPVWSHAGIICTGEVYTQVVKLTFARGASLEDPRGLFNAGLAGNTRRAIDLREGDVLDAEAFQALVRAAVAANLRSGTRKAKTPRKAGATAGPVKLLSGGNPQIAKADGDAPVQAYIAAMPGWKRDVGQWLDALIVRTVPGVRKAVKWNSPLYGVEGRGWFLSVHCFTKYVKVAFFRGTALRPLPPGESRDKNTRYLDIREGDRPDEGLVASWIRQASALPGWVP